MNQLGLFRPAAHWWVRHMALLTCVVLLIALSAGPLFAQTDTFVDRLQPTDLRVVSYNVLWNTIFPSYNAQQAAKFERVVAALDADIWNLQEIGANDPTAEDVVTLMNSIAPLPGGATWYGHQAWDAVIVSKYPLSMLGTSVNPEPSSSSASLALVDLPDATFNDDFYMMNVHFKCCGEVGSWEDARRQEQADSITNWMRDAREPGGFVNLPADTPMGVFGDLNIVGSFQPVDTLVTGNIINVGTYGPPAAPDWDGSDLVDLQPVHNASGTDDYTWRVDGGDFAPGRLDYIIYTDSVARAAHSFILNPTEMSSGELAATGLQAADVAINNGPFSWHFDHLPLVADFRFRADAVPGDYNWDRQVTEEDFEYWAASFGSTSDLAADGNGNGIVDLADYTVWRDLYTVALGNGAGSSAEVPEPSLGVLLLGMFFLLAVMVRSERGFSYRPAVLNHARDCEAS